MYQLPNCLSTERATLIFHRHMSMNRINQLHFVRPCSHGASSPQSWGSCLFHLGAFDLSTPGRGSAKCLRSESSYTSETVDTLPRWRDRRFHRCTASDSAPSPYHIASLADLMDGGEFPSHAAAFPISGCQPPKADNHRKDEKPSDNVYPRTVCEWACFAFRALKVWKQVSFNTAFHRGVFLFHSIMWFNS